MFDKILKYFIYNYKINYALFFLIFAIGIFSYYQIPKEVSPNIEPNSITIRGNYTGASVDVLNNMAVQEIEDEVQNIVGVESVYSIISPGKFSITLELENSIDKIEAIRDVEDSLALIKANLPADMDDPIIRAVPHARSIMHVSILSSTVPRNKLKSISKEFKSKLLSINNVSDVTIFGDSELFYEILIDENKINAYDLSLKETLKIFTELSYIFPMGKIDNEKNQYFISMINNKQLSDELKNTIINIKDKQILLNEIATIEKKYEDSSTLASMNANNSITLAISQKSAWRCYYDIGKY